MFISGCDSLSVCYRRVTETFIGILENINISGLSFDMVVYGKNPWILLFWEELFVDKNKRIIFKKMLEELVDIIFDYHAP